MEDHTNGLREYAKEKSKIALEKVNKVIREISQTKQKINFNSVSKLSGVSKTFLYKNEDIKKRIEEIRDKQTSKTMNQRVKYGTKTKDIIIMAKDKKIKELQEENKKLKEQLEVLRGKLYEKL